MKTHKVCKGINKASNFDGCGVSVLAQTRKYGLCQQCYTNWLISDDPMAEKTFNSFLITNKKKVENEKKKAEKENKVKLTDWKPKLQSKINLIARLIDIGLPCLARGYHADQIHGGHIFSRGSSQNMKFNLHNIHRQSAQSNHYQNEDGLLREGLVNEYGNEYFEFISSLRETPIIKYSNKEYHDFYKHASSIANEIKKQGRVFDTIEKRIFMRNEINNQLAIYDQKYCEFKI